MTIFRLALVGQDGYGSEVVNVMHYETTVLGAALDAETAADIFAAGVETVWEAVVGNGTSAHLIAVRVPGDPTQGFDKAIAWDGARAGTVLPPQIAGHLSFRTSYFGRRGRGGIYVPSPTENDNDAGAPNATYKAALDSLYIGISALVELGVVMARLVVYSRVDAVARQVVSGIPSQYWASLDKRKPGRGA